LARDYLATSQIDAGVTIALEVVIAPLNAVSLMEVRQKLPVDYIDGNAEQSFSEIKVSTLELLQHCAMQLRTRWQEGRPRTEINFLAQP